MKTARLSLLGLMILTVLACNGASRAPAIISSPRPQASKSAPTRAPVGLSVDNPVPLGSTLIASDGAAITIRGISARGAEAARLTQEWNQFNDAPGDGMEYVMIAASVGYEGDDEETLKINPRFDFRIVVSGNILDHADVCCAENRLEGEMFPGGLIEGPLIFEVPIGSTNMVVIYTVPFSGSCYLAVQ